MASAAVLRGAGADFARCQNGGAGCSHAKGAAEAVASEASERSMRLAADATDADVARDALATQLQELKEEHKALQTVHERVKCRLLVTGEQVAYQKQRADVMEKSKDQKARAWARGAYLRGNDTNFKSLLWGSVYYGT